MTESQADPLAKHVERAPLDRFTIAVTDLTEAVKRAKPGDVGRALSLARTHAETAELWLQAAERIALGQAERPAQDPPPSPPPAPDPSRERAPDEPPTAAASASSRPFPRQR